MSNSLAIIPIREHDLKPWGGMPLLDGEPLLAYTINHARSSRQIDRVVVSSDSDSIRQLAVSLGAEAPFKRPDELVQPGVPMDRVLRHAVEWMGSEQNWQADLVVQLEVAHPVRPEGLIDAVIETIHREELDSVFAAYEERSTFWHINEFGEVQRLGRDDFATRHTRPPIYREASGLVCVTRAHFVRQGRRLGERLGLVPVRDITASIDIRDAEGLLIAEQLVRLRRKKLAQCP